MVRLWGASKKKLADAKSLLEDTEANVKWYQQRLVTANSQVAECCNEIRQVKEVLTAKHREQDAVEAANKDLELGIETTQLALVALREQVVSSKEKVAAATKEKEDVLRELAELEELVRQEHEALEASSVKARRSAEELKAEQEEERRKWRLTCDTHAELRRELDASAQQCQKAQTECEDARTTCRAIREDLLDAQREHARLAADHGQAEMRLAAQHEERLALEEEIKSLVSKQAEAEAAQVKFQADHAMKKTLLAGVNRDLNMRATSFQKPLGEFAKCLEDSRRQRDRAMAYQSSRMPTH